MFSQSRALFPCQPGPTGAWGLWPWVPSHPTPGGDPPSESSTHSGADALLNTHPCSPVKRGVLESHFTDRHTEAQSSVACSGRARPQPQASERQSSLRSLCTPAVPKHAHCSVVCNGPKSEQKNVFCSPQNTEIMDPWNCGLVKKREAAPCVLASKRVPVRGRKVNLVCETCRKHIQMSVYTYGCRPVCAQKVWL